MSYYQYTYAVYNLGNLYMINMYAVNTEELKEKIEINYPDCDLPNVFIENSETKESYYFNDL
jgi:hypothetical protein